MADTSVPVLTQRMQAWDYGTSPRREFSCGACDYWIDCYLHAVLNLGPVRRIRFDALSFDNQNAYSL